MDISIQHIIHVILVILTGLSAGLCFTWGNAVTPGIGKLDDLGFLMAFQQMNRVIINPTFFFVFIGPFFLGIINLFLSKNTNGVVWWLLLGSVILYGLGVILVTVLGNVPLNEMIDQYALETLDKNQLNALREAFENKWNRFHVIRMVSAIVSFISFLITTTQITTTI